MTLQCHENCENYFQQYPTFTLTSPALGGATWISVTSRGFLASQATAALQVMVLPLVAARLSMKAEDMARTKFLVAELSI